MAYENNRTQVREKNRKCPALVVLGYIFLVLENPLLGCTHQSSKVSQMFISIYKLNSLSFPT